MNTYKKDFVWNMLGSMATSLSMPLMIITATRISGIDVAGKFSIAIITAQWLMILGNYGVRVFQVSDIREEFSFSDYLTNRVMTCTIMILFSFGFIFIRGYDNEMAVLVVVITFYKMIDAFADVFEGRLQQKGYLYIAGQSLFLRTILSIFLFALILVISNNILFTSVFILIAYFISFLIFTIRPWKKLAINYESKSLRNVAKIFHTCFPLFIALFMLAYINNSPKYAIEKVMSYEYQTYFNAIYFPAQTIYLFTSFVFKPLLSQLSEYWINPAKRYRILALFRKIIVGVLCLTVFAEVIAYFWGVDILSWLFGVKLSNYKTMLLKMILGGSIITVTNFLYHVLTVMRKQNYILIAYGLTFLLSLFTPNIFIGLCGFSGAVTAYLIMMIFLAVLMTLIFFIGCKKKD